MTEEIKKDLKEIAEMLPNGAISEIADKVKYSQSYVSKFFHGEYEISTDNEKIIDAAIEIMQNYEHKQARIKQKLSVALAAKTMKDF